MERAAIQCADWIRNKYPANTHVSVFAGPGNNGGDGLAIARILCEHGFSVRTYVCGSKLSDDALRNYERLLIQKLSYIKFIISEDDFPGIKSNEIVIDALFGSGLSRPTEGLFYEIIKLLNRSAATVISIDIPSGLFSEDNSGLKPSSHDKYDNAVRADYTLSFELPFLSFFFPDAQHHIGNLHILSIGLSKSYLNEIYTPYHCIDNKLVSKILKVRNKFDHKGNFGHALIIAGSYGKMGAAVLASRACLRAGVGLLSVHVPTVGYSVMQTAVPEAMVCNEEFDKNIDKNAWVDNYSAIGIGPGLGKSENAKQILKSVLQKTQQSLVIDADAINLLAENEDLLDYLPVNSILTPHIGEFRRIAGEWKNNYDRLQVQRKFSQKHGVYIVLKGHNTSITTPDGRCFFNSSGNPGMATAGSGDVLTGIISSLLAQSYNIEDAAIFGVYLHGLAGDIAADKVGENSIIASDIIDCLGNAYKHVSSNTEKEENLVYSDFRV